MKLLVFYIMIVLISLIAGSERGRSITGHTKGAEEFPGQASVTAEYTEVDEQAWLRAYMLMIRRIVPAKVLDLPGDNGSEQGHLFYKMLHPAQKTFAESYSAAVVSHHFLQLLSARHSKGFYIYFLEKLII